MKPEQKTKMIKDKLALLIRDLISRSDLKAEEADVLWQWLEQVKAVPFWAGLGAGPGEETLKKSGRPLVEEVGAWFPPEGFLALEGRIEPYNAREGRRRLPFSLHAGSVGEGSVEAAEEA